MTRLLAGHILWPLTERLVGRDTMRRYRELRRTEYQSRTELQAIQTRKLRRLLKLADARCPFYRRRFAQSGLDVNDAELGLDVLHELPLLERSDIQDCLAEMTWHDCPGGPARPYNTGGSSGEPLSFYFDRCRQSADWAARWRHRRGWNIPPGVREVMLWAGPMAGRNGNAASDPRTAMVDRLRSTRDRLLNQYILDAFNMTAETMDAYACRIEQLRPQLLYGYSSSLALLARHLIEHKRTLEPNLSPRAVFVTGETVAPADANDIRSAFGSPVVIEYGSRDCGFLAGGCEAGRLHVADENAIVEVIDDQGRPAEPGEVGEVVVTCLEAFATPLIRYRVGDLALVPPDASDRPDRRCPCGRASTQLMEIRGRVTDQIVRRDAGQIRRMHALSLMYVLREAQGLRQFRIVQRSLQDLDVEVVADERFTPAVQKDVLAGLHQRMGDDVCINILRRESIAPSRSGKHACVVSNVNV